MTKNNNSRNFFWAISERSSILIFQFFAIVYLSRILLPYDFGLIAILNIFITLSRVIVDSGMVGALIKKQIPKPIDYYTLYVYNLTFALLLYLILYVSAPFISDFYKVPIMVDLIRVLSLSILISSFGLVQLVKLTREFNFKTQAIITIGSQLLSVICAIFLAEKGYGVWSLVALQLVYIIASTFFLVVVNKFIPKFQFSRESFKEQFGFGAPLLFSNILYIINVNIYNSLIGKVLSTSQSGFFYQAERLQNTPTGILSAVVDKVAFAVLAKENSERILFLGHRMYKVIYLVIIPIFVYVYLIAEDIFLLIFDENWNAAAKIFKILCLSIIPLSMKILNRNLLKSLGATKSILKIEVMSTVLNIVILSQTIFHGLEYISFGVFISNLIIALVSMYYLRTKLNYFFYDQLKIIVTPLIFSILLLFVTDYLFQYFLVGHYYLKHILSIIFFFFFFTLLNISTIKNLINEK